MAQHIKQILESAVRLEEYSHNLYLGAAGKTDVVSVNRLLIKLADQEKLHKEKLETLNFKRLTAKVIPDKINRIDVEKELMLTPISELGDLKNIFRFALRLEQDSKSMYLKLTESTTDQKAKDLFLWLSGEEETHLNILNETMNSLGIGGI